MVGEPLEPSDTRLLAPAWAHSTWATRLRLWDRLQRRGATTPIEAVRYLSRLRNTPQTLHTYAKALRAMFTFLKVPTTALDLYISTLQTMGALVPRHQAKPITPALLKELLPHLPVDVRATVLLCYKAAGRWTETASLTRTSFPEVTRSEVVVYWGHHTKTTRKNPYNPSMYTVVMGDGTAQIAERIEVLRPGQPMTSYSAQQVTRVMRRVLGLGFSSHSLKHGAITELLGAVARGALTMEEVMRIAKHKQMETTLRYAGDPATTARAIGTQRASSLLSLQ
eukprot:PhM_4_TR2396/c7_g2_i1/m.61168